jgi:hypothetical protein
MGGATRPVVPHWPPLLAPRATLHLASEGGAARATLHLASEGGAARATLHLASEGGAAEEILL